MSYLTKWAAALLTICVATSCTSPIERGDFCDLAGVIKTTRPEVADAVLTDPPFARGLAVHNRMVGECPR